MKFLLVTNLVENSNVRVVLPNVSIFRFFTVSNDYLRCFLRFAFPPLLRDPPVIRPMALSVFIPFVKLPAASDNIFPFLTHVCFTGPSLKALHDVTNLFTRL